MNELISKNAVIDAIDEIDWYHINENGELVGGANSQRHTPLYKADDVYKAIDDVHPNIKFLEELSDLGSKYKCFDDDDRPMYHILSEAIGTLTSAYKQGYEDGQDELREEIWKHEQDRIRGAVPHRNYQYLSDYWCECGWHLGKGKSVNYCANCGKKVRWDG